MAEKEFIVTGDQLSSMDAQMCDIKRQLRLGLNNKKRSPLDPELVKLALQKIDEGIFFGEEKKKEKETEENKEKPSILRLISGGSTLTLKASDGRRLIADAKSTFTFGIHGDVIKLGLNDPVIATPETLIEIHAMVCDGNVMDIFKSLPGTWSQKWLSQNQVIDFCETLFNWLNPEGDGMFALIKKDKNRQIDEDNPGDNLDVVYVNKPSFGKKAEVCPLWYKKIWFGKYHYRVVSRIAYL